MKARQILGKYRIISRLGEGGFATVYRAYDMIEGIPVALKIPHKRLLTKEVLETFRKEVQLTARLDHPSILQMKNASFIGRQFVVVYPLGEGTLEQRLNRRLSTKVALGYVEQMLEALAYAHQHRIIHCDIKPDNFILFPGGRIRLADFGIAKVVQRTGLLSAKGTGTLGYVAPEQALGKPSFRSDVFSLGLVFYRMFSGHLPEWPYEWPPPGNRRIAERVHADFLTFTQRALQVDERKRYKDAIQMLARFRRTRKQPSRDSRRRKSARTTPDWRTVKLRDFRRSFGKELSATSTCGRCHGPISEAMQYCPWCGARRRVHRGAVPFPRRCNRCGRGVKLDWRFCAWCYGPAIGLSSNRSYSDTRYTARCTNASCRRRELMPFMRYCPWCGRKVRRKWRILDSKHKCDRCGWGVLHEYWSVCPWCGKSLAR
ncbi:MAG: protein kinase [Gemmatimonadota bacterium]|nr:MAG: protein kinase [Gemmatimonadota bacterium]